MYSLQLTDEQREFRDTLRDFVTGEIEHAIHEAWTHECPQVILLEGQGSIGHPAYPGGFELIGAGQVHGIVLQHAPARRVYDGFDKYPMGSLDREIQLLELLARLAKVNGDLLRAHEFVAEPVRDGREAVARAREVMPDLSIMDIQRPHVTGYELILELMTDEQLRDEVMTLFIAGHETTANTLTWTWYLLCRNPEVERLLHAEVDALGHVPTMEDLPRLEYTRRIVMEAMRLYPPAYALGRRALADLRRGDDQPVARLFPDRGDFDAWADRWQTRSAEDRSADPLADESLLRVADDLLTRLQPALLLITLGVMVYLIFPAAPPWMAARFHLMNTTARPGTRAW